MVSKKNLTKVKLKTFCNCQNIFSTNFHTIASAGTRKGLFFLCSGFNRQNAHERFIFLSLAEFNHAISQRKECEVSSYTNIFSCVILCAALANQDVAGNCRLAAVNFYTKTFALRITSVLYTAFTFFMCHEN
jgi:hypothetical protein